MLLIQNLSLPLETDFSDLKPFVQKALGVEKSALRTVKLYRKSVDARRDRVHFCCSVLAECENEAKILRRVRSASVYKPYEYVWKKAAKPPQHRPVVVGFGPAGMFAALALAEAGLRPLVFERGGNVDSRTRAVEDFFRGGKLDKDTNIQFGEGGAGTFSDGKLNSGIKDPRGRAVLETFVRFGAPAEILTDAKPHVGSDLLKTVVKNLRKHVENLGGEIHFNTRVEKIVHCDGVLCGVQVGGEILSAESVILATGHSARDMFSHLKESQIALCRKPFAMGVRIEHLQKEINRAKYGRFAEHPALAAADYKLAVHLPDGNGVYTFCMCPGGSVINASSEVGGIAVNGMSLHARDGKNANSALLVGVPPELPEGQDVLAGCDWQRQIEETAYTLARGKVPVSTVGALLSGGAARFGRVEPTVLPAVEEVDLSKILPPYITESLRRGLPMLGKKLSGFDDAEVVLTAPETRSSSPVRVVRGEDLQSLSVKGLYPCGEGAGYAGGILSSAVDGLRCAEAVIFR